jgi:nitrous oxidase accessory protein NosD
LRVKTAVFLTLACLLLTSSFTLAGKVLAITPRSACKPDAAATPPEMMLDSYALEQLFPWVGVKVDIFPGRRSVQYVNSSDYFYVSHGFAEDNWSSLTPEVQSAFLDPQQTNFTLETSAIGFQNPPLTQFTYYNSTADNMLSLFWYQFHPGDLAPGAYSFTGTWSMAGAANPPDYNATYDQNTITLVVNPPESTMLVSCSPNPVAVGWPVACTATVYGSNPSGTVAWSTSSIAGSFSQSVCTLSNGSCSTTYTDNLTGSVTIAAYYGGDSNNAPSSGSTTLTVTSGGPVYYSENYSSVQAAVNAAPPGATVVIAPGLNSESLTVNKKLTIIGEKDPPIFSGRASGTCLTLLSGASGSTVTGIVITNYNEGILVVNASDCQIYCNIMASMGDSGIVLEGSDATGNGIYNNVFQDTPTPINLTASAVGNTISGNMISSQATVTLNVGADDNRVYGNVISANQIVVNATNSEGNIIYHNNFLAAAQITVLATGNNAWDNGYPSGGNYWSNYAGVDENGGPYQNVTGSDGVGDTPYVVATNNTDRYPLMKPWTMKAGHSVAVISVMTDTTVIGQGFNCNVTVNVADNGEYTETFSVTVYANTAVVGTQQVSNLNATCPLALTFTWNTTGLAKGNYTLSAYAMPVAGQTNIADNNLTGGMVYVGIPGDINGDGTVNILDAIALSNSFLATPGKPKWNPNADINKDNAVNILDAIILANHFLQHYP